MQPLSRGDLLRSLAVLTLATATEAQSAKPESLTLPDTPIAKQLTAFLSALNSGKPQTIRAFVAEHMESPPNAPGFVEENTNRYMDMYRQTQGFTIRKIIETTAVSIKAAVQAKSTGAWMNLTLFISAQAPEYTVAIPPYKIVGMGLGNTDAPLEFLPKEKLSNHQIQERIRTLMNTLVAADAFSGTVLVAQHGKPIFAKAYGLASRAWGIPNRMDTRFHLASITKMFTAVAIAQLVEQKKLAYTNMVGEILPDYPNKEVAGKVRLHHLLSHRSGLIGARALVEKSTPSPHIRTIAELLPKFVNEPLSFPPGQQYDYSNAGFELLGAVIEKASGQNYYDYVRSHIFKPAGMTHTDFLELDSDPPNMATGYKDGPNRTRQSNIFDLGVIGTPAGGAYSTGEDMVRFQLALTNHVLLQAASLATLWTGVSDMQDREYGYGAELAHYNGTRIVGHGGGWQGITNRFEMYPDLGYTVVILSNIDSDPNLIALKLREWLTQGAMVVTPTAPVPPRIELEATVSSPSVAIGSVVTIEIKVRNRGGDVRAGIVDMEIKDAQDKKVNQQFTMDQRLSTGSVRTYTYTWQPTVAGIYTVEAGLFAHGWRTKHAFEKRLATIEVR
ncbi:MAG: serine hydrolase [Armatimonas sp.]